MIQLDEFDALAIQEDLKRLVFIGMIRRESYMLFQHFSAKQKPIRSICVCIINAWKREFL